MLVGGRERDEEEEVEVEQEKDDKGKEKETEEEETTLVPTTKTSKAQFLWKFLRFFAFFWRIWLGIVRKMVNYVLERNVKQFFTTSFVFFFFFF